MIRIKKAGPESAHLVLGLVGDLLEELGEEGEETGIMDIPGLQEGWRSNESYHHVFLAFTEEGTAVGASLLEEIKSFGKAQGWRRIDVTAPESERWSRTRQFYESQGFSFTGPKLKYLF